MNPPVITIEHSLAEAIRRLAEVSESSRLDAEALLAWVLGIPRSYLFAHPELELNDESICEFSNAGGNGAISGRASQ